MVITADTEAHNPNVRCATEWIIGQFW